MTSTSETRTAAKMGTSPASKWPANLTVEHGPATPGMEWVPGMPGERFDVYVNGEHVGRVESFAEQQKVKVSRGVSRTTGYKMRWQYDVPPVVERRLGHYFRGGLPCTSRVKATAELVAAVLPYLG